MCMITQALGCTRPLKLLRSHWEHVALHSDLEEKKKKKNKGKMYGNRKHGGFGGFLDVASVLMYPMWY